jgi:predicted transcriptional regulator
MPRTARLDSQGTLRLASKIRSEISDILIQEHVLMFSEGARLMGVSVSAVAKMILRKGLKR